MPRHRSWGDTRVSVVLVDAVAQQIDLGLAGPQEETLTVVRVIGRLVVYPNDLEAQVTGAMAVAVAIGISGRTPFDLGITGTPDLTDMGELPPRGWLYRQQMLTIKDHATGTTSEQLHVDTLAFDVRAARKLDRGVAYIKMQSFNSNGATAFSARLTGIIRTLFLT